MSQANQVHIKFRNISNIISHLCLGLQCDVLHSGFSTPGKGKSISMNVLTLWLRQKKKDTGFFYEFEHTQLKPLIRILFQSKVTCSYMIVEGCVVWCNI
jgi:hypothetical protein